MNPDGTWGDDDDLLAALTDALRSAGPVDASRAAGQVAWRQRSSSWDAALVELTFDSGFDDVSSVRGAGAAPVRLLSFTGENDSGLDLQVDDRALLGQIMPPGPAEVSLIESTGPVATATADALGCFELPLSSSPFRIVCRATGTGAVITTPWVHL